MKYTTLSIKKYLTDLSAKKPVPGGGSASALVSAIGVSCLLMVINYTLNKKGYEKYNLKLKTFLSKITKIRSRLTKCIDLDINLFNKVAQAYKLPKNTKKQQQFRTKKIRKFLLKVNTVEQTIIKLDYETILLTKDIMVMGNKNLISDVGCGILFIVSGAESALLNLMINAKMLKFKKQKILKYINLVKKINFYSQKLVKEIKNQF